MGCQWAEMHFFGSLFLFFIFCPLSLGLGSGLGTKRCCPSNESIDQHKQVLCSPFYVPHLDLGHANCNDKAGNGLIINEQMVETSLLRFPESRSSKALT